MSHLNNNLNLIEYLSKDNNFNKNFPLASGIKNNFTKQDKSFNNVSNSRSGSMNKNKNSNGKYNSKKKYKVYSNSILEQEKSKQSKIYKNIENKNFLNINNAVNNDLSYKINNSFGNLKDFNSYMLNKNNYSNINNNTSTQNFYNKKMKQIISYDNKSSPKKITDNTNSNFDNNNFVNKTQSLSIIYNYSHENNKNYNNNNYNKFNNNVNNFSDKKNFLNFNNKKSVGRPLSRKNDEKREKSRGKPMSLLENISKNKKGKNNVNKLINNSRINKTQFNNELNYKVLNSNSNNYNTKKNISNSTYNYDILNGGNLIQSKKNEGTSSPLSMKYHITTKSNKTPSSNKAIKKSQSLSHFKYNISRDLSQKKTNKKINYSKSGHKIKNRSINKNYDNNSVKNASYKGLSNHKNMIRNKTENMDLNIKNYNNFNEIFNFSNLIKYSSNKHKPINKIKYPIEESKSVLYYKDNNFNNKIKKNDKKSILNNIIEEYNNNSLFKQIKNLWESLGGVTPEYQEKFINYTKIYDNKNSIFSNEINDLSLILNNLNKLNKNIQARNEIIKKIKSLSSNDINSNINQTIDLLISLRKASINVITDYALFLKDISYDVLMNRFDIKKIKNFNNDYLKTMKTDTNFLIDNVHLNKIFNFKKNDPFLFNASIPKSNSQESKYLPLSINNEMSQKINKCQYILLKEKICRNIIPMNSVNSINRKINNIKENNIPITQSFDAKNNNKNKDNKSINKSSGVKNLSDNEEIKNTKNNEKKFDSQNINKDLNNKASNNKSIDSIPKTIKKLESDIPQNININNLPNCNVIPLENKNNANENNDLKIYPYNSSIDEEILSLYKKYLSSIEENMKQSFNLNPDIFYYSNIGIYPKILLFKDQSFNIKGICTICFNQSINASLNINKKILTITSISCLKGYKISTILLSLIEFFKNKNISYDSIELSLYYIKKEDGIFILDEELEKEIKTETKFKWVRLENDGEKRKIKYHYISNNIIENKENSLYHEMNNNFGDINKSAIFMNNYVLIKYYENNANNNISMSENTKLYFILNVLNKYFLLNDNDEKENILAYLKGIKLKKIIRILSEYNNVLETNILDFKSDYCIDDNCDAELLNRFLEIIGKKVKNSDKNIPLCLNFCKLFTNFDNIRKIEIDDYEYNIISMNDYIIEAFDTKKEISYEEEDINNFNIYDNNNNEIKSQNKSAILNEDGTLYYIKSETENISFILYEEKDDKNINEDDNYIKILFNKVLKKILIKDSEDPVKSYKKICIPSFTYSMKNIEKEIRNENDKLKLMEYEVLDSNQNFHFCVEDLAFNDIKFSFPTNKNNNNEIKIIKNNFVIAVLNPDLVLDYHLPALNIYYINKKNWIKVKK